MDITQINDPFVLTSTNDDINGDGVIVVNTIEHAYNITAKHST